MKFSEKTVILLLFCIGLWEIAPAQRLVPFTGKNGKVGYKYKHSGEEVIAPRFEAAKAFTGREGRVKMNGLWGVINRQGDVLVEPEYSFIFKFENGLAKACKGGDKYGIGSQWGYIDKSGKEIVPVKYDYVGDFMDNGLVKICEGGYYEEFGDRIVYPELEEMERARRVEVQKPGTKVSLQNHKVWGNGKWGLYNRRGQLVVPPRYDRIADNSFGPYLQVGYDCAIDPENYYQDEWTGGRQGFIDMKGAEVIEPAHGFIYRLSDELALLCQGDRYFDRNSKNWEGSGKIAVFGTSNASMDFISFEYDEVSKFSEGLAMATIYFDEAGNDKGYAFIDQTGVQVIFPSQLEYDLVMPFKNGLAKVARVEAGSAPKYGLVNPLGVEVVPPENEQILVKGKSEVCLRNAGETECLPRAEIDARGEAQAENTDSEFVDEGWGDDENDEWDNY